MIMLKEENNIVVKELELVDQENAKFYQKNVDLLD